MNEVRWAEDGGDEAVADHVAAALAEGGFVALPGGGTPPPILRDLAARELPWDRLVFSLTDDREVPVEHKASNYRMLSECLGETGARLVRFAPVWEGLRFRLVWAGMGTDGHVASIFPGVELAGEAAPDLVRVRPDPLPPEAPYARVTLNYEALVNTEELILVIRGAAKRRVVEEVLAGSDHLPIAHLLAAANCPVTIFWSET
jgi:6-phosphogluconolactonase